MSFSPQYSWDFLPYEEIEARTVRALQNHIDFLKRNSQYYSEHLAGIEPSSITCLNDISMIPFTEKESLAEEHSKFQVAPEDQVVETVVTSGSTGIPLLFPLTSADLTRLAYNEALCFHSAGVTSADRAQLMVSLDRLFIAGMAYYRGLTSIGVNTARLGVLTPEMQRHYIELMKPSVLVGVPSYLLKLGEQLKQSGLTPDSLNIKKIFCIGEPIRNENMTLTSTAEAIERLYGAKVFCTYASTEIASTFCDCSERSGAHAHPELAFVEILDSNGNPVPDGTVGELVITPFGVEGVPLLRYKTGDLTFKIPGECACGRHTMRIGPILSRKSELLKFKGTTLYPMTITNVLDSMPDVVDYIIELKGREGAPSEEIFIHAAVKPILVNQIMSKIQAVARVNVPVLVSNQPTINSMRGDSRKKIRLIDNRSRI